MCGLTATEPMNMVCGQAGSNPKSETRNPKQIRISKSKDENENRGRWQKVSRQKNNGNDDSLATKGASAGFAAPRQILATDETPIFTDQDGILLIRVRPCRIRG